MSLAQKCYLLSGKNFWMTRDYPSVGIPSITLSDGPHGVRRQEGEGDQLGLNDSLPATCFPTAATVANSWNPSLGERIGICLGEEAASQDVSVLLGPGMNIKRSPLCGRNFEYFSEDPYLSGKMAAGYVRGIQSQGISACLKHFAVNNTELRRQSSDSVVDERTLREIYLTGFEIAVKEAAPKCIMSSYNMVNGVYANENAHLLQEILRDEWGFDGFVVSDWGASNDFVEGVRAGSHLEMPGCGGDSGLQLMKAVKDGKISRELVDRRVDELLSVIFSTKKACDRMRGRGFDVNAHHKMAMQAAEESIVLLKNKDNILPLKKNSKVAVIGEFAGCSRYQGAGSSVVNSTRVDHTMDVIGKYPLDVIGYEPGYPRTGKGDVRMLRRAVELAKKADYIFLYIGLDEIAESEGLDRSHLRLPASQIRLLEEVSRVNQNVIAILSAGSVIEMPWIGSCRAIVHGYLAGQAGAEAILKVLIGDINPSGKLAETYPVSDGDVPCASYFPARERTVEYREGLYVGYRYYETARKEVQFPFGFGLSYTTFVYSNLKVVGNKVLFTITNTGERDGAEIAQVYVHAKDARIYRPEKELKGFSKVFLKAGESREIEIALDDKAFRYFNTETNRFEIDGGEYEILVGASVKDILLRSMVRVEGTKAPLPYLMDDLPSYKSAQIKNVPDTEFEKLLGHSIPDGTWSGEIQINDAICQLYYAKSLKARLIWQGMTFLMNRALKRGEPDLGIIFTYNMPLRAIGKMTGGVVSTAMCEDILMIVNGHGLSFLKGASGFLKGLIRQQRYNHRAKNLR